MEKLFHTGEWCVPAPTVVPYEEAMRASEEVACLGQSLGSGKILCFDRLGNRVEPPHSRVGTEAADSSSSTCREGGEGSDKEEEYRYYYNCRIALISDTHCRHATLNGRLPACDVLAHCGDLTEDGSAAECAGFTRWLRGLMAVRRPATAQRAALYPLGGDNGEWRLLPDAAGGGDVGGVPPELSPPFLVRRAIVVAGNHDTALLLRSSPLSDYQAAASVVAPTTTSGGAHSSSVDAFLDSLAGAPCLSAVEVEVNNENDKSCLQCPRVALRSVPRTAYLHHEAASVAFRLAHRPLLQNDGATRAVRYGTARLSVFGSPFVSEAEVSAFVSEDARRNDCGGEANPITTAVGAWRTVSVPFSSDVNSSEQAQPGLSEYVAPPPSKPPRRLDVLITHGPPRGAGDFGPKGRRLGCPALAALVRGKQRQKQKEDRSARTCTAPPPRLHAFGHFHASRGFYLLPSRWKTATARGSSGRVMKEEEEGGSQTVLCVNASSSNDSAAARGGVAPLLDPIIVDVPVPIEWD